MTQDEQDYITALEGESKFLCEQLGILVERNSILLEQRNQFWRKSLALKESLKISDRQLKAVDDLLRWKGSGHGRIDSIQNLMYDGDKIIP
jgi:hypothetical protein